MTARRLRQPLPAAGWLRYVSQSARIMALHACGVSFPAMAQVLHCSVGRVRRVYLNTWCLMAAAKDPGWRGTAFGGRQTAPGGVGVVLMRRDVRWMRQYQTAYVRAQGLALCGRRES